MGSMSETGRRAGAVRGVQKKKRRTGEEEI
jgi:hypothetical protein